MAYLLTRANYDKLIAHFPEFMRDEYPRFKRWWKINGCWLAQDTAFDKANVAKIQEMLSQLSN